MSEGRTIVEYFAEHERYRCGYCGNTDSNYSHGMWAHTMTVQDYQDLIDRGWRRSGLYCYKPTMNMTCCPQHTIKCAVLDFKMNKSHKKLIKRINRYLIHGIHKDDNEPSKEMTTKTSTESQVQDSSDSAGSSSLKKAAPVPKPGKGADPSLPPCKKAKQIRAEMKKAKTETKMTDDQAKTSKDQEKTLEDFLNEPDSVENPAHRLEIKLIRTSPFTLEAKNSMKESYTVYKKYQMSIHKETENDCNFISYKGFLVDSPLKAEEKDLPMGYGSFHQHYILDGKLIAVGVIDILPYCVSSVYLYYDPDYSFLSLGTYTALREIAFVRELNKYNVNLKYYYMGFYIHSCPKMRYKGQYHPSFLVCPESYKWIPIQECTPKLDKDKYSRLSDTDAEDENGYINVNQVLVLYKGDIMTYEVYKSKKNKVKDKEEVKEYASLTGKTCAQRILLYRK